MKQKILFFLFVLLTVFNAYSQDDIPERPEDIKFKKLSFKVPDPDDFRVKLHNNAVIYIAEDNELPLVEMSVLVYGGSTQDLIGKEGITDMMAQVMRTGGTSSYSPDELDEKLDLLATSISLSALDSQIQADMSCLSKNLDESLKMFFNILRFPKFNEDKIELYKKQTIENIKTRNDHTSSIEEREFKILIYKDHPVNLISTKNSIESITRQDLIDFHKKFFFPQNMIIAIAGNFDNEEVLKKINELMNGWENLNEKSQFKDVENEPTPGVFLINKPDVNQARIKMGHPGIKHNNPDLHSITMMNYILGGGSFTSRITSKIRSDEGLAYSVHSSFSPGNFWKGTFYVQLQTKSESGIYSIKLVLEEIKKIIDNTVSEKELEDAKSFYIESLPQKFSSKFAMVFLFASQEYYNLPKDYYKNYIKNFSKVKIEDVKRVANEYLHPDKLVILIIGNIDEIQKGGMKYNLKLEDYGKYTTIKLPDPLTMER